MITKPISNSSQVIEIGYDKDSKIFQVVFKNNKRYHYYSVEPELWEQAQTCESVGKFVNEKIKPHSYKAIV